MTRRLTSFQLGDVITGEPHLYVGNLPARPSESPVEKHEISQPNESHCFERFVAADTLTSRLGNAFRP
jgi:hypothetical protein